MPAQRLESRTGFDLVFSRQWSVEGISSFPIREALADHWPLHLLDNPGLFHIPFTRRIHTTTICMCLIQKEATRGRRSYPRLVARRSCISTCKCNQDRSSVWSHHAALAGPLAIALSPLIYSFSVLLDPRNEHDACGVGFVVNIKGRKSHDIIRQGLKILVNLDHRGAVGADPLVGDGAGCLIQMPDRLLHDWADSAGKSPAAGRPLRRRHVLPAAGSRGPRVCRATFRRSGHQGGPDLRRLARRTDRPHRPRQDGDRDDAGDPPGHPRRQP